MSFERAAKGLLRGDFSRLEPLFDGQPCRILEWHGEGLFAGARDALNEALTCACFNGKTEVAEYMIDHGVDPAAGIATGLNAFHWAANRGQIETLRLLIARKAQLEIQNSYGGTVLGCAVWSAVYEPGPQHEEIIEVLLEAGADAGAAGYPTGDTRIDGILRKYCAESVA